ncbi:unnamed protein product [Arabidopsis lyrata]|uniref:Uncharacterized protein n=1 Tax=Arabidopsis lyrata subsp. lyrata TaxID=81972 RepID=D7MAR7_ARALL|nr:hypothetical protein ARALYDRAFT_353618 [Arabidopsis lyrata subsp. lyrata]CAH8274633.1 unnamed protein product [Arabidopsis lyrata]
MDIMHRNHQNKLQRINGKRNTSGRWDAGYSECPSSSLVCYSNGSQLHDLEELQNSTDIDEYKLRDGAGAARRFGEAQARKSREFEVQSRSSEIFFCGPKQQWVRKLKRRMSR